MSSRFDRMPGKSSLASEQHRKASPLLVPGKRTLTEQLVPVQRSALSPTANDGYSEAALASERGAAIHRASQQGIAGGSTELPHAAQIQASFGHRYDVSQIRAHVGGAAAAACTALAARAYATGDHIAFAEEPSLHLAAHEAAHVVQHAAGVDLPDGIGAPHDRNERTADAVADLVVAGRSAADLLPSASGSARAGSVQLQPDEPSPVDATIARFDWAGVEILAHYLFDGTDWDIVDHPAWSAYMKANATLRQELRSNVLALALDPEFSALPEGALVPIYKSFHAVLNNGEGIVGYEFLHGTKATVGDFIMRGVVSAHGEWGHSELRSSELPPNIQGPEEQIAVEVPPSRYPLTLRFDLWFQWNDIIDANVHYMSDTIKDFLVRYGTQGSVHPNPYRISISWKEASQVTIDSQGTIWPKGGYPLE